MTIQSVRDPKGNVWTVGKQDPVYLVARTVKAITLKGGAYVVSFKEERETVKFSERGSRLLK